MLANLLIKRDLIDNRKRSFSSVLHIIEIVQDCGVPVIENKMHLSQLSINNVRDLDGEHGLVIWGLLLG